MSGNNKHLPLYIAFYVQKILKISQCCLDTGFVPCLNVWHWPALHRLNSTWLTAIFNHFLQKCMLHWVVGESLIKEWMKVIWWGGEIDSSRIPCIYMVHFEQAYHKTSSGLRVVIYCDRWLGCCQKRHNVSSSKSHTKPYSHYWSNTLLSFKDFLSRVPNVTIILVFRFLYPLFYRGQTQLV